MNTSASPAFAPGPALSLGVRRTANRSLGARSLRATASVEAPPSVAAVTLDNEREGGSVIRITGEDKPYLLRQLNDAVSDAGFEPQRINLLEFVVEDTPATVEYVLDSSITDVDVTALRAKAESVWASADPHPPAVTEEGPKLAGYNVPDKQVLPEEAVEQGMWFDVDPYAHSDWTTLTSIVPAGKDSHVKMMNAMAEQNLNIIFATIRSVAPCDAGYATDVYLLQTMAGKPMAETERVNLHNAFVDALV